MKKILYVVVALFSISNTIYAQCEVIAIATPNEIVCGESVILSAFGTSTGSLVLDEDFNTGGFGPGWSSTPGATNFSNPCSPAGVDGTTHAWMDNNTTVPRALTSASYDLSAATAGVTICFDMLFAEQGNAAPCEGPDEPDEGVFLQYSIDGGATWIDIHYFDPNGGNDPQLTNWNNWCFPVPGAGITANTMFQWYQEADSGADYDHWGIDNVQIFMNDINSELVWQHDGYSYGVGSGGGDNPTPVTPTTTTTYTVEMTTGSGAVCTQDVTVVVTSPTFDVNVTAAPSPICDGDCATISGTAQIIQDPGGIETYENNEFALVASGSASVNINVQGINTSSIYSGLIQNVTINGFNFSGSSVCTNLFGGCDCNGVNIAFGATCTLGTESFTVTLTSPGGCTIILAPAGVANGNYNGTVFVPVGGSAFGAGFPSTAGPWDPNEPFANLNGCDPNGVWTLSFDAPGLGFGLGTLTGWSITFDDPAIYQPVCTTWNPTTDLSNPSNINTDACPTMSTDYTLTVSNCVPGCPTYDEVFSIIVDPCSSCIPPNLVINPLQECSPNTVDLSTAIGVGSDPATLSYYATQTDAQNATNPISPIVGTSGSYWVLAVDPGDPTCFMEYEIVVTINDLSYNVSLVDETCGSGDGQISLTANLGVGPYSYSIDGGTSTQGTGTFSGLSAGAYNIVITDLTTGCSVTGIENIGNLGGPSIDNITPTDPTCPGACDGTITVTVSGGNPPYSYQWYDGTGAPIGPNAATITGLCPDNYQVEVSDAAGGTTQLFYDDFETGAPGWNLNQTLAAEGADPNYFEVDDDEGGVAVGGCGIAGNGNSTLHITSVFFPGGGAAYDAGGLCGLLFCPETHRQSETPLINTVGQTGLTLNFDFIANGDIPIDQATVWYDDGGGWTQLGGALFSGTGVCAPQGIWTAYSSPLPASCENIPNLQIAIRWDNNDDGVGSDPSVAINNIEVVTSGAAVCSAIQFATITDPVAVDPSFTLTDFCVGTANSASGIVTPGGTFSYNPNPGDGSSVDPSTGEITNGVVGTTYTIEYNTGGACPETSTNTVTVNGVDYNAVITDENCGSADGEIDLTPVGGTAVFTYSINNGATTQGTGIFTGLSNGNYDILITDGNGCQITGTETIANIGGPTIDAITPTDPTCAAACDGEITVTVSGGTAPYGYQWYDAIGTPIGPNAVTITGLCAGDYSIDVTDVGGVCVTNANTTLVDPVAVDPSFTLTDFCIGTANSASGIVTPGGTFSYNPNPGDGSTVDPISGEITNGIVGTTYVIEYNTGGACPEISTNTVTVNGIDYNAIITDENCGAADGEIDLIPIGGIAVFTYSIDNGTTTQGTGTFSSLTNGNYNVLITDGNGCQTTGVEVVGNLNGPTINSITPTDPSCSGICDAEITITVVGGTPPYSYQWFDAVGTPIGPNAATITGLCAGDYSVEVTDASGGSTLLNTNGDFENGTGGGCDCPPGFICNNDAGQVFDGSMPVYTVGDQGCVSSATNYTNSLGANSGTGYVYFYAGADNVSTGPFAFVGGETVEICVWYAGPQGAGAPGQNTANAYFTLGVDGVSVSPNILVPTNTGWTQYCFTVVMTPGNHTFEILSGGAAQYSMWFDDFTITDISGGVGGCPATSNAILTDPAVIDASFLLTDYCEGNANGATGIATPGGTFSYNPNPGDGSSVDAMTGEISNGVIGTTYTIEYNTGGACPEISTNNVTVNGVTFNAVVSDENCGSADGEIDISIVLGIPTYSFSIDNGVTTQPTGLFSNLTSGVYNIVVTDNNGCQAIGTENVGGIGNPSIDNAIVVDESCLGNSDGNIDINMVSGGSGSFDYSWDIIPDPAVASVTNLPPGTYTVTVTDQVSGCSVQAVYNIVAGPICCNLGIDTLSTSIPTCGQSNGEINATAIGGTGVYFFSIDNGPFTGSATFSNLASGSYELVVQDDLGVCSDTIVVQLLGSTSPSIDLITPTDVMCNGELNGEVNITVSGGTGNLDIEITDGIAFTENNGTGQFSGLAGGNYTISVTDQNNCEALGNFQILEPTVLQGNVVSTNESCFGLCDGVLNWSGTVGGISPYNVTYNGITAVGLIENGVCSGMINYSITDANGCTVTSTVEILPGTEVTIDAIITTDDGCSEDCDGSVTIQSTTGTVYTLNGVSNSTGIFTDLCSDIYGIMIEDINGCGTSTLVTVDEAEQTNALFAYTPGYVTVFDNQVQFFNSSTNAVDYIWTITGPNGFIEVFDYDISSFQFPADSGSYMVCLTTISSSGCQDTYCAPIVVQDPFLLYVPNTFTPNNDESNQFFQAYMSGADIFDYEMTVYNRWGEVVWESFDIADAWDGTYHGRVIQDGVYTWKITVKLLYNDDRQIFTGHVSVIR